MVKFDKKNLLGQLLLFLTTIVWGSAFIILKTTIENVPKYYVLGLRFFPSGLLLLLIFIKRFKNIKLSTIKNGVVLGLVLGVAYVLQTVGVELTTASRNAFITASYCVMTPFLAWLMLKQKPKAYNVLSAVICIVGIGFVALSAVDSGNEVLKNTLIGDALTLACAVFYALQIIFIDKYQHQKDDTIVLLCFELLTVGVLCFILSLIFELPMGIDKFALNIDELLKILYLTIACTLFAQMAMIYGQKYTTPNQVSLILSLEAVFGTLFSVIIGDEKLTVMLVIGFAIVFIAMIINELKLDPFKNLISDKK